MEWDGKGDGKRRQGDGEEGPLPPLCLQFEPPSRCLSQWLLQRLLMVVEWSGEEWSAEAWHGVLWWWWKLCVFLCHIPIYINLVFAMTDDICQCQTFSFQPRLPSLLLLFLPARTCKSWLRLALKSLSRKSALYAHDFRTSALPPPIQVASASASPGTKTANT